MLRTNQGVEITVNLPSSKYRNRVSKIVKMSKKIIVALGGASGSIYAKVLFDRLLEVQDQWEKVGVVMSENARLNWQLELKGLSPENYPFDYYHKNDFMAPFASGSANYEAMIIVPCSMGLLGRIAHGISDDLTSRAADVILKERRKLIVVPREAPFSSLHLRNMLTISEFGGIICPASPSFYSKPDSMEALASTVSDRVLALCGFRMNSFSWGESND